jgi:hypothetical protein
LALVEHPDHAEEVQVQTEGLLAPESKGKVERKALAALPERPVSVFLGWFRGLRSTSYFESRKDAC